MSAGLTVTGLSASHGTTEVLHEIDVAVADGALACFIGASGCGKTTLLRTIAGFHRPSEGKICLHERVLDQAPNVHVAAERRRIGYIPQDVALFPHLSVRANIGFGLPRKSRADRVTELLSLIDLAEYGERYPHELSGGQQQRVAIARALAPEPQLLLLDEPFSALDTDLRSRVRSEVIELLRASRTTAVMVTHDAAEALAFADMITVLEKGKVLQTGTPEALHNRPSTASVARALSDANVLPASFDDDYAITRLGKIPLRPRLPGDDHPNQATDIVLRPQQITVESGTGSPGGTAAIVKRQAFRGTDHRLEITVAGLDAELIAYTPGPFDPDTPVYVSVLGTAHPIKA